MIVISKPLQKRLDKVPEMGRLELLDFRAEVATSLLDTQTKFYCYTVIEKRLDALEVVLANSEDCIDLDCYQGVEDV